MADKTFLIGLTLNGPKTQDKLELGGKALEIQQDTAPLFKKASETTYEDQRIFTKLSNILNMNKPDAFKDKPSPTRPK